MKYKFTKIILLTAVVAGLTTACTPAGENIPTGKRYEFNNILDITYTPDTLTRCGGWFTDAGSWMGFTLPQKDHWVNGFCGPVQSGYEPTPMDGAICCHGKICRSGECYIYSGFHLLFPGRVISFGKFRGR